MQKDKPLSKKDFDRIYSKVPRLTVEVILLKENSVLLTKRAMEPAKGLWHIPGGSVFFDEDPRDAVKRVAKQELNLDVLDSRLIDFILYPRLAKQHNIWPVGAAYVTKKWKGEITLDDQATEYGFFDDLPRDMVEEQRLFLADHLKMV